MFNAYIISLNFSLKDKSRAIRKPKLYWSNNNYLSRISIIIWALSTKSKLEYKLIHTARKTLSLHLNNKRGNITWLSSSQHENNSGGSLNHTPSLPNQPRHHRDCVIHRSSHHLFQTFCQKETFCLCFGFCKTSFMIFSREN